MTSVNGADGRDALGIAACIVVGSLVVCLSWFKLGSLDTGYHLAYGRHFLETGAIVRRDPFLYPSTAIEFVNANWAGQVVMALVERTAGAAGLVALRLVLIGVVFALIAAIVRRFADGWAWVAWAWVLGAAAGYERFSLRPELFSYAAMMTIVYVLVRGVRSWRGVACVAIVQLAWVNLHSYFLVGPMVTGAFLLGAVVQRRRAAATERFAAAHTLRLVGWTLLVQVVVLFANPAGYRGVWFPLATLQFLESSGVMVDGAGAESASAWSAITEFHSPFAFLDEPISGRTIRAYLVLLGVAALGVIALVAGGRIGSLLAMLILLAMSLKMRRNIAQFAFAASPLALGAVGALVQRKVPLAPIWKALRAGVLAATMLLAGWWIYGLVEGRFYYAERRITRQFGAGYHPFVFPEAATRWIAARDALEPELFVNYFASSNALPWLPARFRLYCDTNTFSVADDTLQMAFDLGVGAVDHGAFFDAHGVNVVLLHCGPNTQILIGRLLRDVTQWALVYADPQFVVFIRRMVPHLAVLRDSEIKPHQLDTQPWLAAFEGPAGYRALHLNSAAGVPLALGAAAQAVPLLEEAVGLREGYYEAWTNLGVCHGMLANAAIRAQDREAIVEHLKQAEACFNRALAIRPDYRPAAQNLERVRLSRGG